MISRRHFPFEVSPVFDPSFECRCPACLEKSPAHSLRVQQTDDPWCWSALCPKCGFEFKVIAVNVILSPGPTITCACCSLENDSSSFTILKAFSEEEDSYYLYESHDRLICLGCNGQFSRQDPQQPLECATCSSRDLARI